MLFLIGTFSSGEMREVINIGVYKLYSTFYHLHTTRRLTMSGMAHNPDGVLLIQSTVQGLYKGPVITCQSGVTCQKKHTSTVNINLSTASKVLQSKLSNIIFEFVIFFSTSPIFILPNSGAMLLNCFNSILMASIRSILQKMQKLKLKLQKLNLKPSTRENLLLH